MEEESEQIVEEQFVSTISFMLLKHRDFMIICVFIPLAYHAGKKWMFHECLLKAHYMEMAGCILQVRAWGIQSQEIACSIQARKSYQVVQLYHEAVVAWKIDHRWRMQILVTTVNCGSEKLLHLSQFQMLIHKMRNSMSRTNFVLRIKVIYMLWATCLCPFQPLYDEIIKWCQEVVVLNSNQVIRVQQS